MMALSKQEILDLSERYHKTEVHTEEYKQQYSLIAAARAGSVTKCQQILQSNADINGKT